MERTCATCATAVHAACWERAGGCGQLCCPEARAYRRWLIGYLDKQLCADLAVVSWVPCFVAALLAAAGLHGALGAKGAGVGGAVLAMLLVPVAAVLGKRAKLRGATVWMQTIVSFARVRHARQATLLARKRALVARLEDAITTPLLFLAIAAAGYESWSTGSLAGGALAAWLAYVAQALYLGPSRRALENPVRDFPRWEQGLEARLAQGPRAVARADGGLVPGPL